CRHASRCATLVAAPEEVAPVEPVDVCLELEPHAPKLPSRTAARTADPTRKPTLNCPMAHRSLARRPADVAAPYITPCRESRADGPRVGSLQQPRQPPV